MDRRLCVHGWCSGVFKESYFYKHVKICQSPEKRMVQFALGIQSMIPAASSSSLAVPANAPTSKWDKVWHSMDKDEFFDIIR